MSSRPSLILLAAVTAALSPAALASVYPVIDIVPLWQTRNDANTDYFYSVDPTQRDLSISCCGYHSPTLTAYLPRVADSQAGTHAWARYWKGLPQNEHFYTHLGSERSLVESMGWRFEREEGAVFAAPATGLADLHRVNKFNGSSGDLQHFYTTNATLVPGLQAQGWGYDGVKGHAFKPVLASGGPILHVARTGGSAVIEIPSVADPRAAVTDVFGHGCGGRVDVLINGQYVGTYSNWTYGLVTTNNSSYGCRADGPFISGMQTNNVQLIHTGFAARINASTAGVYSWGIVPPSSSRYTVGSGSSADKMAPAVTLQGVETDVFAIQRDLRTATQLRLQTEGRAPITETVVPNR